MIERDPEKILVIMLAPVREFVLAAGAMARIRDAHPDAQITLLTTLPFEGLARAAPYFDTVQADGDVSGLGERLALIGRLRRARFRKVYDLQGSSASRMIVVGLGPFGPARPHPPPGAATPPDLSWIVRSAPAERPVRDGVQRRPYALLAPGPSETPAERRWSPERYAEFGRALQARGLDVIIVGGPQDGDAARAIQRQLPGARDLTGGPDFARLALLAARATVAVGADCGVLHLAAAAGAPTVVLYGADDDPALRAPRGHVAVLHAEHMDDLEAATVAHAVDLLSPIGARSA